MRPAFRAENPVRNPPEGTFEAHAPLSCLIDGVDKKPPGVIRGPPSSKSCAIPRAQRPLQPVSVNVFDRRVNCELSGGVTNAVLLSHFLCLAAAGFREQNDPAPGEDAVPRHQIL